MKLGRTMAALGVAGALLGSAVGAAPTAHASHANTARLYISDAGNGYYLVVVDGHSSAVNAPVGIRVYGDDEWFDDWLFNVVGYARTGPDGSFNVSQRVHGSVLNEDWGRDEIYAIADAGGSIRTQTISRSF